jgi:hypothetical protein
VAPRPDAEHTWLTLYCMASQPQADADSLRFELQEATTTFRHQVALLIQAFGVIATVDSALLAYGFAQKESGILLVASMMPIVVLLIYFAIISGLIPVAYVAMRLERKLSMHEESLITTWVLTRDDLPFSALGGIDSLDDPTKRDALLNMVPLYLLKTQKGLALLGTFAAQLILFVASIVSYHFKFM